MKVFFNNDTHLTRIEKISKLDRLKTVNWYRVFGLKQENNPPMIIEYKELPAGKTEKEIKSIMKKRGIPVVFDKKNYGDVAIGLRKDLRDHNFLAAAALNLLIGYLENKLTIKKEFDFGFQRIGNELLEKPVAITYYGNGA